MGILIQTKKQILPRILIGILLLFLTAFGPVLVSIIGAYIIEYSTGNPCHEGNCAWAAVGWLSLLTMPIAMLAGIAGLIIVILDIKKLNT